MDYDDCSGIISLLAASSAACLLLEADRDEKRRRRKRKRLVKSRPTAREESQEEEQNYEFLIKEPKCKPDGCSYRNYLHMSESCFKQLLEFVRADLTKKDTVMRPAVLAEDKLDVTLRFLATGDSFRSLEIDTKLSDSLIGNEIPKVCDAIYKKMKNDFLRFPQCKEDWKDISDGFSLRREFPLCLGALDKKHIACKVSKKDGKEGLYLKNVDGISGIVLSALTDAYYNFIFIDIAYHDRATGERDLNRSDLMNLLGSDSKYLPKDKTIGNDRILPHVIVADDALPLQKHIMTPYPDDSHEKYKKIFNVRLNHARQTVEDTFDILFNRFKVLQTRINLYPSKVESIVKACCVLHNFLIQFSDGYADVSPSFSNDQIVKKRPEINFNNNALIVRDTFADYFCNEGKVPWQEIKL